MKKEQKEIKKLTAEGWRKREFKRQGKTVELIPGDVAINTEKRQQNKFGKNR